MPRYRRSRKPCYLTLLPPELMEDISGYLERKDYLNLCAVSMGVRKFFLAAAFETIRFQDYPTYLEKALEFFLNPALESFGFDDYRFDARRYIRDATIVVRETDINSQPLSWSTLRDCPQNGPMATQRLPSAIAESIEKMPYLRSLSLNLKGLSRMQEDHFRQAMHTTERWQVKDLRITDLGRKNIVGSMIEHCEPHMLRGLDIAENCYTSRAMSSIIRNQENITKLVFRRFVRPGDLTLYIMNPDAIRIAANFPKLQWLGIVTEMKGHASGIRRHITRSELTPRIDAFAKALQKLPALKRLAFTLPSICLDSFPRSDWASIPGLDTDGLEARLFDDRVGGGTVKRMGIKLPHIEEICVFHEFPLMTVGRHEGDGSPMSIEFTRVSGDKPKNRFPYGVLD